MKTVFILLFASYGITWLSGIYISKFAADKKRGRITHFGLSPIT